MSAPETTDPYPDSESAAAGIPGDPAAADPADAPAADPDPLHQALLEAAQWKEVALRTGAELDNYRKRMAREMQDAVRYGSSGVLEALLPVLDNFDYGLQAAKAEADAGTSNLYVGLTMVLKQFQDFLRDQGVEEVACDGAAFDPKVHDAVAQQPSDSVPEGHVISRTRKGYKLHDRLLRPAAVVVSSGPPAAGASTD